MGAQVAGVATRGCPVPPAGLFCSYRPRQECQECEIPARCPVVCSPPRAAPHISGPLQEQDIHPSDTHSHTSCYQEKTLSQRLEWALINRVATGPSSWGRGAKCPLVVTGYGQEGGSRLEPPGRAGGGHRVLAQPCHRPAVPHPLLSPLAELQGSGTSLYRGDHPAPWWGLSPSSPW